MGTPTRFPNGVTNNKANAPLADLPTLDPTRTFVFFDDFDRFNAAASGITGWHADTVGSPTVAVLDAFGGHLQVTNAVDTTAATNAHYQWGDNTDVIEQFTLAAGKKAWLKARFKVTDADQNLPMIGLHVAQDDPWGTEPADQFLFRTQSADADALEFAVGKTNSTEVEVALGNLADDTFVEVTAFYDGKDTVFVTRADENGVVTNTGKADVTSSTTGDLLPDTEMTVAFGHETIDGVADNLTIDYILVARER